MNVSSYQELLIALAMNAPIIIVTNDIVIEGQITINYAVAIQGIERTTLLQRSTTYSGYVFNITANGQLLLQDLIVDGGSTIGLEDGSSLINSAGTLNTNNVTLQNSSSTFRGGALMVGGASTVTVMNNTIISNCSAVGIGGAIYVGGTNKRVVITNSTISGSFSGSNGGAIYTNQTATLSCTTVTFIENEASTNGGVLFANINTTTTISNCQCMMNVASNGGAIFANASTTPEIVDTVFTENIARANGGAVYLNNDSNSLLSRNSFERNEAINGAGLFVNNAATMNLDNTSFTNNVASNNAGALFMNTNTQSTITACTSRANVAVNNGGAMYANIGAILQLENSLIDSNIAGNEAGGIYVNSTANATVSNAEINGNEAVIGGAVSINTNGSMMITNSRIIDNNASVRAGAINNFGALTLINRVDFGPIGSNEAPIAPGIFNAGEMNVEDLTTDINGVYIVDAENVIRIINPLFAGSVFQLDTSEYVFPDPERSPIVVAIPTPQYPVLSQSDANAFLKPVTGFEDWEIQLLNNQVVLVFNPSPLQYTITYVGVLSTINPNPTSYRPEDLPIVLQDPNPVEGYEFIGWFDELGNQVSIIPQGTVGDIVLYARYRETGGAFGEGQMITNRVRVRCCPCDAPAKE
ncbi:right-handed parallel beta-helix repeat-containing protein [Geomicrobium sediminis]|uniref:Right handed beta helix domain-containing protein n=1 Tax=Geomicrobium sediminis TaxID=1347788 RepID=A0ABS2PCJ5_9BACL|nr:right-handed parallel beta-helix repeat-containing protein [Geomicrobium sediminis]MBM7633154.1 hypothetical protein [Geomicrobium sediminis]